MNKNINRSEIAIGIVLPLFVWILAFLLTGELFGGGDMFDVGYPKLELDKLGVGQLGLGKIYFVLFLVYNIGIAIFAKKKSKHTLFLCSSIVIAIPLLSFAASFLSYLTGVGGEFLSTVLYIIAIPAGTAIYTNADSVEMTVVSWVVVFLAPIAGLITYKFTKTD
ncbi:MAG: hypothetical protein ACOYJX_05735 [Acutalibacteraceae bacterium]|jgi:hypothetical protein